jgi:hypothetical protein
VKLFWNGFKTKMGALIDTHSLFRSLYGNRTRVTRMKIWCPNP